MSHDVFISYSSFDKAAADATCAALEGSGIRCWIAPRDIIPGKEWGDAIIEAIHSARVLVLIFSASANASPQIRREVERAVHKGLPIIPLRIEDIAPTHSLEYFIGTVHWLDALTPPFEGHLRRLSDWSKRCSRSIRIVLRSWRPPRSHRRRTARPLSATSFWARWRSWAWAPWRCSFGRGPGPNSQFRRRLRPLRAGSLPRRSRQRRSRRPRLPLCQRSSRRTRLWRLRSLRWIREWSGRWSAGASSTAIPRATPM